MTQTVFVTVALVQLQNNRKGAVIPHLEFFSKKVLTNKKVYAIMTIVVKATQYAGVAQW